MSRISPHDDRGAAAIFIALVMVLLLGFAAIAIDLGLGFNERRVDQTAADTSVMAGAVGELLGESPEEIVAEVLSYARQNLPTDFTDEEWRLMWQGCADPDRFGFDVGGAAPVDFQPMPEPAFWPDGTPGSGTLDCISSAPAHLRVRIPDQDTPTTFARILGMNSLTTSAAAVARWEDGDPDTPIIPFGIPAATPTGEQCIHHGSGGTSIAPCDGSTSGNFGAINSPFFGDFFDSTGLCSNSPGHPERRQNTALGVDHFISVWSATDAAAQGVVDPYGSSGPSGHPGDNTVRNYQNVNYDSCRIENGSIVPRQAGHSFPPNTVNVDTGLNNLNTVEEGLISGTFLGQPARLRQGAATRTLRSQSNTYNLDNVGLWTYLNGAGSGDCHPSAYTGLPTYDEDPDVPTKVSTMHSCLANYTGNTVIFSADIDESPRFAWAPEFWHQLGNGNHWQPIYQFRMVFLAGLYFNCSGNDCDAVFYPDEDETDTICEPIGPNNCKKLDLDQLTGWLIPAAAVPETVIPDFGSGSSPSNPTLFR